MRANRQDRYTVQYRQTDIKTNNTQTRETKTHTLLYLRTFRQTNSYQMEEKLSPDEAIHVWRTCKYKMNIQNIGSLTINLESGWGL
jgi:hypothetical protein